MKARINEYATSVHNYKKGSHKTAERILKNNFEHEVEGYALYCCPKCGAVYKMYISKTHMIGAKIPDKFICMACIDSANSNDDLGGAVHFLESSPFEKEENAYKIPENDAQKEFLKSFFDKEEKVRPLFDHNAVNLFMWSVNVNSFVPILTCPNELNRERFMVDMDLKDKGDDA